MAKYKYHPSEDEGGSSYIYTNENIDFYLDGNKGRGTTTIMIDPAAGKNKFAGFRIFNRLRILQTVLQTYTKSSHHITRKVRMAQDFMFLTKTVITMG